jgi:predicted signal transduction protein with EAL and GGDEF domain
MYPDDAENVPDLISIADYALYEAKRAGKNRFCANGNAARQAAQAVKPTVPAVAPVSSPELAQHR